MGSHLLRFAVQRHVGDLSLAHKLWDLLIAQGDIPERASCRTYLVAMEQREPGSAQLAKASTHQIALGLSQQCSVACSCLWRVKRLLSIGGLRC